MDQLHQINDEIAQEARKRETPRQPLQEGP
jgi:hypothetical protein